MPNFLDIKLLHYSGKTDEYTYTAVIPNLIEAANWASMMFGDLTIQEYGPVVVWQESTLRIEFAEPAMQEWQDEVLRVARAEDRAAEVTK